MYPQVPTAPTMPAKQMPVAKKKKKPMTGAKGMAGAMMKMGMAPKV